MCVQQAKVQCRMNVTSESLTFVRWKVNGKENGTVLGRPNRNSFHGKEWFIPSCLVGIEHEVVFVCRFWIWLERHWSSNHMTVWHLSSSLMTQRYNLSKTVRQSLSIMKHRSWRVKRTRSGDRGWFSKFNCLANLRDRKKKKNPSPFLKNCEIKITHFPNC